jgi:hypothetical protein
MIADARELALPLFLSGVRTKSVVPRVALELSSFNSLVQPLPT